MAKTLMGGSSCAATKDERGARNYALLIVSIILSFGLSGGTASLAGETNWDHDLASGYDQLSKGNTEVAIKFFQDKVRKHPTSAACHTGLGKAWKRLHKISEAKEEFRRATECDPTFADGFYELGAVLEDDKDWQNAATAFEKYLELKPDAGNRKTVADRITFCRGQKPE
jgi:tetratricopeptide (TPR) repeat protein